MGMWGAEVLITLAEGGHSPPSVSLPSTLVVRGSTGPAPPSGELLAERSRPQRA